MTPAISVIIPCYNEAALLPRLLTSIETARRAFSGGPEGVEIIVSDNASTDDTAAIAVARGCRVVSSTILRIGAVRNAGAASARGSIVAFIDADSQVHPDTFNVIAAFMTRPDVVGGTTGATMDVKLLFALRRIGRARGSRLVRARDAKVTASARKFDQFGDWHYLSLLVKGPWYLISRRTRDAFADQYWYKFGR
jgi:glycosyltransferase involved in cell wall biosynthesis